MQKIKHYTLLFLKGLSMGTADVIPSISSGTIAFITGIYTALLNTIRSFNKAALQLLLTGKWKLLWTHIHGSFLLPVGLGIMISLLTTARLVRYLLIHHPIETWSFFFGLSLLSSIAIFQQVKKFTFSTLLSSCIGGLAAYLIIQAPPISISPNTWFIFLSGALATCAMILPGISGSFVLLILGKYSYMIEALVTFNWPILAIFILGGLLGLFAFSRWLIWLLHTYPNPTIALLAGFMLGSIPQTWPWKTAMPTAGEIANTFVRANNISPMQFQLIYKKNPHILPALFYISLGCLVVIILKKLGTRQQT